MPRLTATVEVRPAGALQQRWRFAEPAASRERVPALASLPRHRSRRWRSRFLPALPRRMPPEASGSSVHGK